MSNDIWNQRERRRRRMQFGEFMTGGALLVGALGSGVQRLQADDAAVLLDAAEVNSDVRALSRDLEDVRGRLALTEVKLQRATAILGYSTRYRIPADLASAIYDIALTEGIQPAIGFQLVKVESSFRPDARSVKGAIGYTQLRLPTARSYDPTVTIDDLHNRDLNLRFGFRYLRDLLRRFDGDLSTALIAYNRGPTLVDSILVEGGDPRNGYAAAVMRQKRPVTPDSTATQPPQDPPVVPPGTK